MPSDKVVFQRLDELLGETNDQIDAILGGQNNPQDAIAFAVEIKEKARLFYHNCCERYYRLRWQLPENKLD